jgi:predicted nucleic acid-binding Zn ribbon protein
MPTYIYYDPETNDEIEKVHEMKESPVVINPKTGNKMKIKITGGMHIIFKGSGWTGASTIKRDDNYHIDRNKDEIRSGLKEDPYSKWREEPL